MNHLTTRPKRLCVPFKYQLGSRELFGRDPAVRYLIVPRLARLACISKTVGIYKVFDDQ